MSNYYGLHQSEELTNPQQSCCKRTVNRIKNTFNSIRIYSREKPYKFDLICLLIINAVIIIIALISWAATRDHLCDDEYSDECLYDKMISKKKEYPEGMKWDNSDTYYWKGGIFSGGGGCAGFAFMLSDVCFGDIKAKQLKPCPNNYKVGDVVRINNDSHSVIILKIENDIITIAEGNYGGTIHWGRTFKFESLKNTCNYILRRNPN